MQLKHLTDYQLSGKRVMLRADMNVPLKDGIILNEERIDRTLPTIDHILREGGKLILLTHLGRPKETNEVQEEFSLKPVVNYLEENRIDTRAIMAGNLSIQPAYRDENIRVVGDLTNSNYITENSFFIGCHSYINKDMQDYVELVFHNFFKGK